MAAAVVVLDTVVCFTPSRTQAFSVFNKDSLYDLWNSEKSREFRAMHKEGRYYENPICLACSKDGM